MQKGQKPGQKPGKSKPGPQPQPGQVAEATQPRTDAGEPTPSMILKELDPGTRARPS